MTRDEAASILSVYQHVHRKEIDGVQALQMAIEALKQEPCGDAISRQEALNVVHRYFEHYLQLNDDICLDGLRSLPSVTPQEPKTGQHCDSFGDGNKWIPVSEKLPEEGVVTEFVDKEDVLDIIRTCDCNPELSMQEKIDQAYFEIEKLKGLMILPNTFPEDE